MKGKKQSSRKQLSNVKINSNISANASSTYRDDDETTVTKGQRSACQTREHTPEISSNNIPPQKSFDMTTFNSAYIGSQIYTPILQVPEEDYSQDMNDQSIDALGGQILKDNMSHLKICSPGRHQEVSANLH